MEALKFAINFCLKNATYVVSMCSLANTNMSSNKSSYLWEHKTFTESMYVHNYICTHAHT